MISAEMFKNQPKEELEKRVEILEFKVKHLIEFIKAEVKTLRSYNFEVFEVDDADTK